MKKLLTKILLLFLLCNCLQAQEGDVIQEIRNFAVSDVSPLKELVEAKIKAKGVAEIDLFMGSMYGDGIILQQALLPIIKMYESKVNFEIHYFANSQSSATATTATTIPAAGLATAATANLGKKAYKESLRQIAIANLYPELYLDYLLLRGEDLFEGKAGLAIEQLKIDAAALTDYMTKKAPAIYMASVSYSNTMYQIQDRAILVVDGEKQIFSVLDYLVNSCPSYFNCLDNCTSIHVGSLIGAQISCTGCLLAINTGLWPGILAACSGCIVSAQGVVLDIADIKMCMDTCESQQDFWPNPNDVNAVREAHSCDGDEEYCVMATYDQAFAEQNITTNNCISCAKEQDIFITTRDSKDYFSFTIPEPELNEFPFFYTLIEPKPIIQYDIAYTVNNQRVYGVSREYGADHDTPNPGSNPLDRYYGDHAMFYPAANINIGDKLKIEATPVEKPFDENCPTVSKEYNFDCPSIELVPNYADNTFYVSVEIPENSPFNLSIRIKYSDEVNSHYQTFTESGISHIRDFDPNSTSQIITISTNVYLEGTYSLFRLHQEYAECEQEISFHPFANRCYAPENIIGVDFNNITHINLTDGMTVGSAEFEITNATGPVDWFLLDGNDDIFRSAINTTNYSDTLLDLPPDLYTLHVNFSYDGEICFRKPEFTIVTFCSNLLSCETPITLEAIVQDATAGNQSNGSIKMLNVGLTYFWSDLVGGTTNPKRTNLAPGEYCVEAYDDNCCFGEACFTIGPDCDLDYYYSMQAPCKGKKNGSLDLFPSGGTPPYKVVWSNGDSGPSIIDLAAGNYSFTLTDVNSCILTQTIAVPNLRDLVTIETDPATHTIQLIYTGGAVDFYWSGPGITSENKHSLILEDVPFGVYCLFMETEQGCKYKECINFLEPLELTLENLACMENITGVENTTWVCASPTGGSGSYSYQWSNVFEYQGQCSIVETGEEFCVTVTDNTNIDPQSISVCMTIGDLSVDLVSSQAPCKGKSNGQICVEASGGGPFYLYHWPNTPVPTPNACSPDNLEGDQTYVVTVTDACDNSTTFSYFLADDYAGPSITNVDIVNACTNSTNGSITLEVTGGSDNMTYAWFGNSSSDISTTESSLHGIPSGSYYVIITHACGVSKKFGPFEVGTVGNDDFPIDLVWEVTMDCNFPATPDGAIVFANPMDNGDLTFYWEFGSTSSSPTNLAAGDYTVTATLPNGCEAVDVVNVPSSGDFILSHDVMGSCGKNDNGAIELELAPGNYDFAWNNGASSPGLTNLSPGTYRVTVTDMVTSCTEVQTFEVVDDDNNPDFTYEVDVTHHFNNETFTNGSARVCISSPFFSTLGTIAVNNTNVTGFVPNNSNKVTLSIPVEYRDFDTFTFVYESPNGCTYEGSFDTIPTCANNDAFSFNVELVGDAQESCALDVEHEYKLNVFSVGANPPYFIEVRMIDAFDDNFEDYVEVFPYTGPTGFTNTNNPFEFFLSGIPSGEVYFRSYNNCNSGNFVSTEHNNCCRDLSCELLSESYDPEGEGSAIYRFDFFKLKAIDLCFDDGCGGIFQDSDCSEIIPEFNNHPPIDNCWFGTVTIQYPSGPDAVFTVSPDLDTDGIDVYDEVDWVSNVSWEPENTGTFPITIIYDGDPEIGSGVDCQQVIEVTFYGPFNYEEVIGFNDNFWFTSSTIPDHFFDSYHGVWSCQKCGPGDYIFNNDQDECDEFFNWNFTHFNFEPLDFADPCNSGGLLTIMSYNEDGEPTIESISIAPDRAIDEYLGARAFESPHDNWCNSGWCLFDGNEIYEITGFDKPILATWYDPQSCVPLVTIDTGCDGDYPCIFGECVDGECVETEECIPECPEDYICEGGICVLDVPIPCEVECDCPDGHYCNGGECEELPRGIECFEGLDCQCPENYICNKGQCVFDPQYPNCDEDHPCPEGEYCKNGECRDCPNITIDYCYGTPDCPSITDCILDYYISSDHTVLANVIITRNGLEVGNFVYSIWNTPRHIQTQVPIGCTNCAYEISVEFGPCPAEVFTLDSVNCTAALALGSTQKTSSNSNTESSSSANETSQFHSRSNPVVNGLESGAVASNRFLLYPNPFDEVINVEYTSEVSETIEILVTDIFGRQIQKEAYAVFPGLNNNQIRLGKELTPGVYYVQISNQQGEMESFKLIHYQLE